MIAVSDLFSALEQVPAWRKLIGLPKRVLALEQQIAALEAALARVSELSEAAPKQSKPPACPGCGMPLAVKAVTRFESAHLDALGFRTRVMTCTPCRHVEERLLVPNG